MDTVDAAVSDDATINESWAALLDEMEAIAEDLEADGWETLTIGAGDSAPVTPEESHTDTHGYAYVVPGDAADTFEEWFVPEGFPRTEVYQATAANHLFLLTVFLDPPTENAILLAGVLDQGALQECKQLATETGVMYSHIFRVDGTHLGSFEHEKPALFFPDA